jgi:hypothetical protein
MKATIARTFVVGLITFILFALSLDVVKGNVFMVYE